MINASFLVTNDRAGRVFTNEFMPFPLWFILFRDVPKRRRPGAYVPGARRKRTVITIIVAAVAVAEAPVVVGGVVVLHR